MCESTGSACILLVTIPHNVNDSTGWLSFVADADLAANNRHCNRAYAGTCLQWLLPNMVMALLGKAFGLLCCQEG